MQNVARFRVANNVYQTRDNYMVPRFHSQTEQTIDPSEEVEIACIAEFEAQPFLSGKWDVTDDAGYKFFYEGTDIGNASSIFEGPGPIDFSVFGVTQPCGIQWIEKLGNLYLHWPFYGMFKYDGFQPVYRAGVPLPFFSSAQADPSGTTYVRILQHKFDFQNNTIHSGYVQFRATPAAGLVSIRHDNGATDIVGTSTEYVPLSRTTKFNGTFDEHFFVGTGAGVVSVGNQDVTIPSTDKVTRVGSYIMITASQNSAATMGLTADSYGVAMRVKSFTGTHITLDLTDVMYVDVSGAWNTGDMSTGTTYFSSARTGANYWMSAWTSDGATNNYVWKDLWPVLYNSGSSRTDSFTATSPTVPATGYDQTCFSLAGNMSDFYDVTTIKDLFPSNAHFGTLAVTDYPNAFSTYGDLAIVSTGNEVHFSDTSLGGAFEMVNGLSFISVGEGNDGTIQSVCGNSDFMIVSRKRNNYYLSGNLPTANYRVQKIPQTQMGSYSNETMLSHTDKVLLLNKQGIWAIYAGGRCEEISSNIRGFFDDWSESVEFAEEVYWDIDDLSDFVNVFDVSFQTAHATNQWIRMRTDVVRGLVYILNPSGQALILSMNNGEFYTWSSLNSGVSNSSVQDLTPINGYYYAGVNASDYTAYLREELKTGASRYGYGNILLETTWFTAGEPSLEKKLNQVKLWGFVTAPVSVSYYQDWITSTEIGAATYSNSTAAKFSHKHQVTPASFLAVSISFEVTPGTSIFQIEGLEIEFQPFQQGMKR